MRPISVSLLIAGLAALCACRGIHSFTAGVDTKQLLFAWQPKCRRRRDRKSSSAGERPCGLHYHSRSKARRSKTNFG